MRSMVSSVAPRAGDHHAVGAEPQGAHGEDVGRPVAAEPPAFSESVMIAPRKPIARSIR